jgi:hypothetical protein
VIGKEVCTLHTVQVTSVIFWVGLANGKGGWARKAAAEGTGVASLVCRACGAFFSFLERLGGKKKEIEVASHDRPGLCFLINQATTRPPAERQCAERQSGGC